MSMILRRLTVALALLACVAAPSAASEQTDDSDLVLRQSSAETPAAPAPRLAGPACQSDCMLKHAMCRETCVNGADAAACISTLCEPVQRQCSALCMPMTDRFAMRCLDHDQAAVALLEEQGVLLQAAVERLGEAHATLLRARAECARGEFDDALALYDRIVPILSGDDRQGGQAGIDEPHLRR